MMKTIKFLLLGSLFLLMSCSTVKFYSDSTLKKQTGLRVYSAKPYLLVEYNSDSVQISSTMLYLPDLANPQYVKYRSGIGTASFNFGTSSQGFLNSYNSTADNSKIPDAITAATGLLTGATNAATSVSSLVKSASKSISINPSTPVAKPKPYFELYEFVVGNNGVVELKLVEKSK